MSSFELEEFLSLFPGRSGIENIPPPDPLQLSLLISTVTLKYEQGMTLRPFCYRHVGFIMTTTPSTYCCLPSFTFPFPVPFSLHSQHSTSTCVFNLGLSQCEIPAELYWECSMKFLIDAWAKFLLGSKPWLCMDKGFSLGPHLHQQQCVVTVEAGSCTGRFYSA